MPPYTPQSLHRLVAILPEAYALSFEYAARERNGAAVRSVQAARLKALLEHALTRVPHYRSFGDLLSSVSADPHRALRQLPLVTREDLRDRFADMCDDEFDPDEVFMTYTSGTSGTPLATLHDLNRLLHTVASGIRWRQQFVEPLGHRAAHIVVQGDGLEATDYSIEPQEGLAIKGTFDVAPRSGAADTVIAQRLRDFNPQILRGQTSSLTALAAKFLGAGEPPLANAKAVITGGEDLNWGARSMIERALGAPVYDSYGLREVGPIAWECNEHDGYHIDEDRVIVEIVNESGEPVDGEQVGEVAVTSLLSYSMPILRYRTGDEGSLTSTPCECGVQLARLQQLRGRREVYLTLPDGSLLHARHLWSIIEAFPIAAYQIRQLARDRAVILIVPAGDEDDSPLPAFRRKYQERRHVTVQPGPLEPQLENELRARLPAALNVSVEVASISSLRGAGSKLESFVSYLPEGHSWPTSTYERAAVPRP